MPEYTLHGYFRSSCTARIRLALNLKEISFDYVPVNLLKSEQLSDEHKALNPSATVPLLARAGGSGSTPFKIGQSVAALEYLEEAHPDTTSLLPKDADTRAVVRALANIVACDIQPVTNLRIIRRVKELGGNSEDWVRALTVDGLMAYEATAKSCAGTYSVGDSVTVADVCLLPAVWNAQRFGVDLSKFPTVTRVSENLEKLPAVQKSSYFKQADTPEDLRA